MNKLHQLAIQEPIEVLEESLMNLEQNDIQLIPFAHLARWCVAAQCDVGLDLLIKKGIVDVQDSESIDYVTPNLQKPLELIQSK